MGKKAEKFLQSLLAMAFENGGLALLETWKCSACQEMTFCFHRMSESIPCGNCGHRAASRLPRYQLICEAVADSK